jgi:hypothetical protein
MCATIELYAYAGITEVNGTFHDCQWLYEQLANSGLYYSASNEGASRSACQRVNGMMSTVRYARHVHNSHRTSLGECYYY